MQRNPYDAMTYVLLGDTLVSADRTAEGMECYRDALRLQPDLVDAHIHVGLASARMGKDAETMAQFSAAVQLQLDHAEGQLNLGISLARLQRFAEAVPHFEAAARLRPGDETITKCLSLARARLGQEQRQAQ